MCRILIMSGIKSKNKKITWEFIKRMGEEMSNQNTDGLGYAAVDREGKLFGERWWMNWEAFDNRSKIHKPVQRNHAAIAPLKKALTEFVELDDVINDEPYEKYNSFGEVTEDIVAITLHTRMATSGKGFENTHPFVDESSSTSLIHNGIIRNHTKEDEIRSTCDSERILNKYLAHDVAIDVKNIQKAVDDIKGYMACGIFAIDNNGERVLDVFKTSASLSAAFIKELDCLVLSTQIDDIKKVVNQMGLTIVSKANAVKEDTIVRFNVFTGEPIALHKYKDTTRQEVVNYNHGYGSRNYNGGFNDYSDTRYLGSRHTSDRSNVFAIIPGKTLTEVEKQEVVDMRTSGFTEAEIRSHFFRKTDTTKVVSNTIDSIQKVADLVNDLNETEAALDGYYMNDGVWTKRNIN